MTVVGGPMNQEGIDHKQDGEYKQWTFGGVLVGLFVATILWNMVWLVGPSYVTLNDGEIIQITFRGMKWVEVGEKTIEVITKSKWSTTKPIPMWGEDCEVKDGRFVCASGGLGIGETEKMKLHNEEFHK